MNFQQLIQIIPFLEQIDTHHCSQTIECPPNQHVLLVVRRGHLTIKASNQQPIICTQGFACHPEHGPYSIRVPQTKEVEYVVMAYRVLPETSAWMLHGPLSTLSEIKIHYMVDELIRTTDEISTCSPDEEAAQQFRKRLMLERMLFIYLYESHLARDKQSSTAAIEETLSYINEHYMIKLTLPLLARRAGMSQGHYTVLFKKHTGVTMTTYLHRLRIEKAKQMFQQTDLLAKEIAFRVGYVDYFHFSRVFKKWTGCSPSVYQQNDVNI